MSDDNWIQVIGGGKFNFTNPHLSDITFRAALVALSRIPRYSGHTIFNYSVLQHSCLVAEIASFMCHRSDYYGIGCEKTSDEICYQALYHDIHEAYIGDITTPLKREIGLPFRALEEKVLAAVSDALNIPKNLHGYVKLADLAALVIERSYLMEAPTERWKVDDNQEVVSLANAFVAYNNATYPNQSVLPIEAASIENILVNWEDKRDLVINYFTALSDNLSRNR